MMYVVTFIQSSSYVVDADTEDEAFAKAEPMFNQDMRRPIARTDYDDVQIEPEEK
jgi:hypothetical protein